MISLREFFSVRWKNVSAHPLTQEPAMAPGHGFAELPLSEECKHALQMRAPERVLEIMNDIDLANSRLSPLAGSGTRDHPARALRACMQIGPA
jgi:hypothetical protein